MKKLLILGGTGHTGSYLADEAVRRGYEVESVSRNKPADPVPGVTYSTGNLLDSDFRQRITQGADVIISALSPRSDLLGQLLEVNRHIAQQAADSDATFVLVGTFGDLRSDRNGPRYLEAGMPEKYAAYDEFTDEGAELLSVLDYLRDDSPNALNWMYVSPAAEYGQWKPGEATGQYRISDEVAVFDEQDESNISSPDFALAILDAVESGQYQRRHVSVAY